MTIRSTAAYLLLAFTATASGCASPVYSPPEHPAVTQQCPFGRTLVCRDRYNTVLAGGEDEEEEFCMCQELQKVR